jgi:hypothetical protein
VIALLFTAWAWAADECRPAPSDLPETLYVAWVSPGRQTVGNQGWLTVVKTQDLNAWVAKDKPTVGRLLQALGERKKTKEPKRRYKVTIFEVRSMDLCLPDEEERAVDTATGKETFDLYEIQWRDAAVRGFCVLPAQRYVEEAR